MLASAEIFDPKSEKWTETAALAAPRSNHVAVALADGRVLIAGGGKSAPIGQPSSLAVTASAEIFDPKTKTFSAAAPLATPRSHFRAVLLADGTVLAAGGGANVSHQDCNGVPGCGPIADPLASVERFDPKANQWRAAAPMKSARYSFTLTLLSDGRVFAAEGVGVPKGTVDGLTSAEIYDPAADTWTSAADAPDVSREHHSAILLPTGDVLVSGGKQANVGMLKTNLVFSPASNAWRQATPYPTARTGPGLVPLASGRVLSVGGYNQEENVDIDEAALYDTKKNTWSSIAKLHEGRIGHTVTVLPSGAVLVAGGAGQNAGAETAACELAK
jgi:N-acetylneuraminic acid mutarotase